MSLKSLPLTQGLAGELFPPGDKSVSHRAVMLGGIAHGATLARRWLDAADTRATLNACRALGVTVEELPQADGSLDLRIHGQGSAALKSPGHTLDLGNSGTGVRLLMGLLAGLPLACELSGDHSLCSRPMGRVIEPLRLMGAQIAAENGKLPARVQGTALHGIDYNSPIASAQVKSALLLAGLHAQGRTTVTEPALSRDHTERMLQDFGVDLQRDGLSVSLNGGAQLQACTFTVPADFSSAAFFLVAGSIIPGSQLVLRNVGLNPTRRGLLDVLLLMGADIGIVSVSEGAEPRADLHVRAATLKGVDVPTELVVSMIDEFPILMAAAAVAEGSTRISGAEELRVKESDRLAVMCRGLRNLGVSLEEFPDGAVIHGQAGQIHGGRVDAADDHRCAMSFAILAACAQGGIEIDGADYIGTSYPAFHRDYTRLGGQLEQGA